MHKAGSKNMVEGGGFEPPKLSRQIYSLIPLAAREPLRKRPNILFTFCRNVNKYMAKNGAGERSRTPDRLITSQLLYQLSYASVNSTFWERGFYWKRIAEATVLQLLRDIFCGISLSSATAAIACHSAPEGTRSESSQYSLAHRPI